MSTLDRPVPTFADVEAAARGLAGVAHRTPVVTSRTLDGMVGAAVFLKCENLQRGGAFKFRGAYTALSRLSPEQRAAGVLAYSSGNHAQAVALAARELGMSATIVMPLDAPASKVAATRGYGAEVVTYDRYSVDREELAARLAAERGLALIPPYDHPDVLAGQGTATMELIEDAGPLDALFVCLGGGGLLSGAILAARALSPGVRIHGVEPEAGDDGMRSWQAGEIVHIDVPRTIADGAQTQHLGRYPFAIIREGVDEILTVPDDALVDGMRFMASRCKLVVEPTGCLALAGVLARRDELAGKRVGVIVSGGNVDLDRFAALVTA
ncbi:MAG: threo-3-hydroxy-L-aspartate ammonia-lyase [Pseudonocardia sp.]|uniref:threo-3-hydroxy-L-aspartate ammonia-lyase n=1 Tax=unclassified Pseudonocardia TaxID=2619320 RepID=UPI00086B40F9|nr:MULTISPECIES: threo-3-hydroxy-L-aspartate ammonia-lyase [unclassified Pseudonocardia]MBN9113484.1 threo-3-hydroxy-L-aspartate ammonia-lyase [Pseudonocardia sp.]ODU23747.1 MAG: serine dehydratase [Pseudonocardia sp. SCN 72-51]ODV01878.1 MAG: serine dehydratase [Pseudonocardia sp. SCN 73-27]